MEGRGKGREGKVKGIYMTKKFDSVFDSMETERLAEFFEGDWFGWIDALSIYPFLQAVEV